MKKFRVIKKVSRDELETAVECGVALEEKLDEYAKVNFGRMLPKEMVDVDFNKEYKITFEKIKEDSCGTIEFSYTMIISD